MKFRILHSVIFVFQLIEFTAAHEYLVSLKNSDSIQSFMDSTYAHGQLMKDYLHGKISKTFSFGSFRGLTVNLTKDVVSAIKENPLVVDVVPNMKIHAFDYDDFENNDGYDDIKQPEELFDKNSYLVKVQNGAPRHLARLSRRMPLPYDFDDKDAYNDSLSYYYSKWHQGTDVNAYIIDSGIDINQEEFEGRATHGLDLTGEGPGDRNGHGTHVAGLVGSKTYGVAKNVTLVEVKALDRQGSGSLITVISALEFVVNHCGKSKSKKCVANLSLGAFMMPLLNEAIKATVDSGVVVVVAAGNGNIDACWCSPASEKSAITVGAFDDRIDTIAKFSNWGSCVDIFAPGVAISSLSIKDNQKSVEFSGTSMASPQVAGIVSILLDQGVENEDIRDYLFELATDDVFQKRTLLFKPRTPNRITFNGISKKDEDFEDGIFPEINVDVLLDELQNYVPKKNYEKIDSSDVTIPMGSINVHKRKREVLESL
ncbi:Rrt12p NDAI_0I00560 [Naumovozyma dairenensis CBS 421]|uniref:Uncharacterized protein n=1 Tax=Naumovozyma dairenensis (strain ATCC 10597 / BCRC 20456 / CBS 421 / NBRC 0211 / NRRL Y-12639) TaxID=1071378 RepID=G0WFR4_NAUDC|nr:hypothetical protein NDAI_0I00560 [Naumovozyma dairenensis CBS 421]CCD26625.1 hypothetical protein NDAI_0I00560 [Naumovozyma dairenensis CBS 421]